MSRADHYVHGDPNMICDFCGHKYKKSYLRETWDHYWVCPYDFEKRQPQDRLRSFEDKQGFDDPRPEGPSVIEYWDGSSLQSGINNPSQDDFLDTNEIASSDLGDGNGSICNVNPSDPTCP